MTDNEVDATTDELLDPCGQIWDCQSVGLSSADEITPSYMYCGVEYVSTAKLGSTPIAVMLDTNWTVLQLIECGYIAPREEEVGTTSKVMDMDEIIFNAMNDEYEAVKKSFYQNLVDNLKLKAKSYPKLSEAQYMEASRLLNGTGLNDLMISRDIVEKDALPVEADIPGPIKPCFPTMAVAPLGHQFGCTVQQESPEG